MDIVSHPEMNTKGYASSPLTAVLGALAKQTSMKSTLFGLDQLSNAMVSGDPNAINRLLGNFAVSATVPYSGALGAIAQDEVKEIRGMIEQFQSRLPVLSESVPASYTIFGEVELRAPGYINRLFNVWQADEKSKDPVDVTLAELEYAGGLAARNRQITRNVDLADPKYAKRGVTAWERYQEHLRTGGFREAVRGLITSGSWDRLPAGDFESRGGPQVGLLEQYRLQFDQVALAQTFAEYPELHRQYLSDVSSLAAGVKGGSALMTRVQQLLAPEK
jgi:hypothetical protein